MGSGMRIGVVTVTYNSAQVIEGFLVSLLRQTQGDFILFAVDNSSSDRTLEILKQQGDPRIVVIANSDNVGIARGNNQGIRTALEAGCDLVLLINNDTEFGTDLLEKLCLGLRDQHCGMIVPKIMYFDEPTTIWCAGGYFDRWRGYLPVHYGQGQVDLGQFDHLRTVEYAPTCCMLVKKEVFLRLGLMDEQFFIYSDDADFCLRAKKAGLVLKCLASQKLRHKVSSLTGGVQSKFAVRQLTRNHIYFIRKNLGFWRSFFYLPAYEIRLFYKLLFRIIDWKGFSLRQSAFFEGWSLPLPKNTASYRR
jgi:GT2 family glycosyltransferase